MRFDRKSLAKIGLVLALCVQTGLALAQTPPTAPAAAAPGGGGQALTSRVQDKTYLFADTNENLPYSVFVSSKVTKDKKAPLVIALRGAGGNPRSVLVNSALQQAEEGGYIMVGVMGYAPMGGFGMDMGSMGARGGRGGAGGRGRGRGPATGTAPATLPQPQAAPRGGRGPAGGTAVTDTAKMSELSEKDLLNVLAIIQKDYNVDERRIYLVGHSLGGGGAIFLGEKYPEKWAGVVALSPGIFGFQFTEKSHYKELPMMILVGKNDTMIASVQQWEEKLKALNIPHEYEEVPGFDHGGIISGGMTKTFAFLAKHTRPEAK
jgi:predicted peptidase